MSQKRGRWFLGVCSVLFAESAVYIQQATPDEVLGSVPLVARVCLLVTLVLCCVAGIFCIIFGLVDWYDPK